jgi:hypothetical protein
MMIARKLLWLVAAAALSAAPTAARARDPSPAPELKVACTSESLYAGRDEVRERGSFLVDGAGRLVEQQLSYQGVVGMRILYKRDQLGRLVEKRVMRVRGANDEVPFQTIRPRYHGKEKLPFETETTNADGTRDSLSRHFFDGSGREKHREIDRGSSTSTVKSEFRYGADGRLEEIVNQAERWKGARRFKRSPAREVIEQVDELEGTKPNVTRYPTPCPESVLIDVLVY